VNCHVHHGLMNLRGVRPVPPAHVSNTVFRARIYVHHGHDAHEEAAWAPPQPLAVIKSCEPDEYTKSCVSRVQKNLILIIHDAGALEDYRSTVGDRIDSGELLNRRQKEGDL